MRRAAGDTGELLSRVAPWGIVFGGAACMLTFFAPRCWVVILTDGAYVALVLIAAFGWGAWPVAWLKEQCGSFGQLACISIALGLGIMGVMVLGLGCGGVLTRVTAWGICGFGVASWLVWLALVCRRRAVDPASVEVSPPGRSRPTDSTSDDDPATGRSGLWVLALTPLAACVAIGLFGACLPPGILWRGEAGGYDALEYHLQAPREYFEAGRIQFLPHNVYASFPQQIETLYLLLMHLMGESHAAAIACQLLHLSCGGLTVMTLCAFSLTRLPAMVVALTAGCVPWLAYLGCLAYVELGMLYFTAAAYCLLSSYSPCWSHSPEDDSQARDERRYQRAVVRALVVGVLAGFACGCKYTAIALVAVPLGAALMLVPTARLALRFRHAAIFAFGVGLALSPWFVRNGTQAGNPVYPFASAWLGGRNWSPAQAQQWVRGHALRDTQNSFASRIALAGRDLIGGWHSPQSRNADDAPRAVFVWSLFGPAIWVLGVIGLLSAAPTVQRLALAFVGLSLAGWATLTHMPGRFAVAVIVPLAHASGAAAAARGQGARNAGVLLLATVLGGVGAVQLLGSLRAEDEGLRSRSGIGLTDLVGQTEAIRDANTVNQHTPRDAEVWLIGDAAVFYIDRRMHYTVVFNRDPWLEYSADHSDPADSVEWLRSRGVTHVVFSWSEIERLRSTYGFHDIVTRAWVDRLAAAGLQRVYDESTASGRVLSEIYEVTSK